MHLKRFQFRGLAVVVGLASAFSFARCSKTSTSTSVVSPSSDKCQISVSNAPTSPFPPSGGSGSIAISTTRDCTWSVSAEASWVSIAGAPSGPGAAAVPYNVASNAVPSPRSCAVGIASQRRSRSQAAAPSRFDLSRSLYSLCAAGGRLSVSLTTLNGCAWTASSGSAWITIQSGQSGNASSTVVVSVAANTGEARVGQAIIAGQTYTVAQDAPAASPSPAPPAVHVTGTAQNVVGVCPKIAFTLAGKAIITDADTKFTRMKCTDVKRGVALIVDGVAESNSFILATKVEKGND